MRLRGNDVRKRCPLAYSYSLSTAIHRGVGCGQRQSHKGGESAQRSGFWWPVYTLEEKAMVRLQVRLGFNTAVLILLFVSVTLCTGQQLTITNPPERYRFLSWPKH